MEKEEILKAFELMNAILHDKDVRAEICLYGGAAMCLVFSARPSTKDVDAVFKPVSAVREAARETASRLNLPGDWLNDGVNGFVVEHARAIFLNLSHLTVYVAEPDYLFVMKAMAARADTSDVEDLKTLVNYLNITSLPAALAPGGKIIRGA
jgi:hypothetical protein